MFIFILLVLALNTYEAAANKYCSLESNGEPKYFICARNEYCCHFGCCVHLAFQFYQLWYYWLLLIFMFMLCSGGSWWYKFCRHHETTYPSLPPSFERQNQQSVIDSRRSRSVERNTGNNSLNFQRIWKANGMGPPPSYYTASVVRYHSASELETRRQQQDCPYYQLYGPPPSYESVVHIPHSGYGQPSCTLVPSTSHEVQQPSQFVSDNANVFSNCLPEHAAAASQQQYSAPSTSVQTEFSATPVFMGNYRSQQNCNMTCIEEISETPQRQPPAYTAAEKFSAIPGSATGRLKPNSTAITSQVQDPSGENLEKRTDEV